VAAQAYVGKFLENFKEFPPRQKPASLVYVRSLSPQQSTISRVAGFQDYKIFVTFALWLFNFFKEILPKVCTLHLYTHPASEY